MRMFAMAMGLLLWITALLQPTEASFGPDSSHVLWYSRPAGKSWMKDALPIGNGKMGAMLYGRVARERIMFNEDSLWIGDETRAGAYQGFGSVYVQLHPGFVEFEYGTSHPSTAAFHAGGVLRVGNGDLEDTWLVFHGGKPVTLAMRVRGRATPLTRYTIVTRGRSGRMPNAWTVEGSRDGTTWEVLDRRSGVADWHKHPDVAHSFFRTFQLENDVAWPHYRFVFRPPEDPEVMKIAEIQTDIRPVAPPRFTEYRRQLDLRTAIQTTRYKLNGVTYRREAFASFPAGVLVFRFTADQPAAYTGVIELVDKHGAETTGDASTNSLVASGDLEGFVYPKIARQPKHEYGLPALQYESQVRGVHQGGQVTVEDGRLQFRNCDSLTLFVCAGTDYVPDRNKGWKGEHPHARITERLRIASETPFAILKQQHISDYQRLYCRSELVLPENKNSALPTSERIRAYQTDRGDQSLESLLFHYGRYLMIASSRPGSLPANLQGVWNEFIVPDWRCDYHTDVNIQMNYWMVDQSNLSECFQPLADYFWSTREIHRINTRRQFGAKVRGWALRSENGIFGGGGYRWVPGDAAWVMQNIWDHYAFTRDKKYLRDRAYPMLKEICEFWVDSLISLPDGTLVAPKSQSPEHGPIAIGNSYEQRLVWDLFGNFIAASEELDIDQPFREQIRNMRSRLLGPQIGRWGQLQEWMEDIDQPNDLHRHFVHLIGVHPGHQISPLTTPELAKAAAVSMDVKQDGGNSWSLAWKVCVWARLHHGDRAYKNLRLMLKPCTTTQIVNNFRGGVYDNLLVGLPPFQIDGNFGYVSGFCELLLQSHLGEIHLLPALPADLPGGSVRGLKARGNVEIDMVWQQGKLERAVIRLPKGARVPKIRVQGKPTQPESDARLTLKFSKPGFMPLPRSR